MRPQPKEFAVTVKIVALWTKPEDTDAFDKDYEATHIPLVAALPGLSSAIYCKALNGPYYRTAELIFADMAALGGSVGGEEGQKVVADGERLQETYGAKLEVLTLEEQSRT
jgi:uncharacterized protein (TIGR02118 family)